jgi:hypothetical protein
MLNAIAIVLLAGMMFIPIINLVVGTVAGTCLFGLVGGFAGAALAALITIGPPTVAWANRQLEFLALVGR